MSDERSDALVLFGATGDLAYKKIFPSLQSMVRRGHLSVPVICIARDGCTLDRMAERIRRSLAEHGGGVDERAFATLSSLLHFVNGDYGDPQTFRKLRGELSQAQHPAHYLAIPPSLFG